MTPNSARPNKPKPRCKNCGDETTFGATAKPQRIGLQWCVPCFTQWERCQTSNGGWCDREGHSDRYGRHEFGGER